MPTYITLKDVKKRWGKGQEDVFPVAQFEKLWGDMTALPELKCRFVAVPRARGQQLKEPAQLDGWLRDGSAAHVESLCDFDSPSFRNFLGELHPRLENVHVNLMRFLKRMARAASTVVSRQSAGVKNPGAQTFTYKLWDAALSNWMRLIWTRTPASRDRPLSRRPLEIWPPRETLVAKYQERLCTDFDRLPPSAKKQTAGNH